MSYKSYFGKEPFFLGDEHYTKWSHIVTRKDFDEVYLLHSKRARIEHINCELKREKIFTKDFRHHHHGNLEEKKELQNKVIHVMGNILNLSKLFRYLNL